MKEAETREGNKLIMFFDGAEKAKINIIGKDVDSIKYKDSYYPEWNLPKFHEDWNLLMPVVEKIEAQKFQHFDNICVKIDKKMCRIVSNHSSNVICQDHVSEKNNESKIITVWRCVTYFIQWWNALPHKKFNQGESVAEGGTKETKS